MIQQFIQNFLRFWGFGPTAADDESTPAIENPFPLYKTYTVHHPFYDIVHQIFSKKYGFQHDLSQLHELLDTPEFSADKSDILRVPELGKTDRKMPFIQDYYTYVDSDPEFAHIYREFIISTIKPLFSEPVVVYQSTPNLRICFPGSTAIGRRSTDPSPDIIGIHSDREFNHPPEEINFIVPITEMENTNSLFYEPEVDSTVPPENYLNLNLRKNEMFMAYFNQLRHFNRINCTGKTRISIDFRIIPYSKYREQMEDQKGSISYNKKMIIGEYFQII